MTLIGGLLAFVFLDWPWRGIVIGLLLLTDVVEIAIWLRWRKKRSIVGAEGLPGARGVAMTACDPDGEVKVNGQIWRARTSRPLVPGDAVRVTRVEGLTLEVQPIEDGFGSAVTASRSR